MKPLKNWDNKTWLSSAAYINSFNIFLLKKKKLNKNSQILDIGCGRGKFFKNNQSKFDLIMIKQTLHFFDKNNRTKLIKTCKKNLKKNGVLIIFSLVTENNEIPCFKLMKQKLNRSLEKDSRMLATTSKLLNNYKTDIFKFKVSMTKINIFKC